MNKQLSKDKQIKRIEKHLRNYHTYRVAIINLKKQLDYIMPNITATYEVREGSNGTFNITSDTEKFAIDRIESKKALVIHEDMEKYKMLMESMDIAIRELDAMEQKFVHLRYLKRKPMEQVADELGFSAKYMFAVRQSVMDKLLISLKGLLQF